MSDAKPSKRDKLLEQQRQLAAKLADLDARDKAETRKADTRRKILIGGAVLAAYRHGDFPRDRLVTLLDDALVADRDRALFEFLPSRSGDAKGRTPTPAPVAPVPAAPAPAPVPTPPIATASPKVAAIDRTYHHNPTPRKEDLI